jgi:hypothetical protein
MMEVLQMTEIKSTLDLKVNDVVLMNVVDINEHGPVFGVIDCVGTMDPEEDSIDSPSGSSQDEQAVTNAEVPGDSKNKDLQKEHQHNSLIAELEERRAALDTAIQEMKREVTSTGTLQSKSGVGGPSTATEANKTNSLIAKSRRMSRIRAQFPDH